MSLVVAQLCSNCKEGKFEEDSCGTESTKTCTSCGFTIQNVHFQGPEPYCGNSANVPCHLVEKYKITINHGEKILCRRQREVLNLVQSYLKRYAEGENFFERAKVMFLRLVSFKKCARMPQKNAIAAAAVITVLRKAGINVLLPKICKEFDAPTKKTMQALNDIKEQGFDGGSDFTNVEDCLGPLLEHHNEKDRLSVAHRTIELCNLFYDLKLDGSRQTMAQVAFYFAVMSGNPPLDCAMDLGVFCKMYNVSASESFLRKVAAARQKILILSKRLPWVAPTVKRTRCHIYIQDILKAKNVLMNNAMVSGNRTEEVVQRNCNHRADETPSGIVITEQMKLMMPKCSIKNLLKPKAPPETPDPEFVSTSEVIGEDEISEQELKELIRSPEEVVMLEKMKNRLRD